MKIWRLNHNENTMIVDLVDGESIDFFNDFVGKPMTVKEEIELKVIRKGNFQDFPHLGGGSLVFNDKGLDILRGLLSDNVQLLDVKVINHDINIKIVNVINVVDAVDYKRSIPETTLSGKINGFKKLNFLEKSIVNQTIFKIPEVPIRVYVSDNFRDVVLASKLKGFEFIEAWDSERTDEIEQEEQRRYEAFLADVDRNKGTEYNWSDAVGKVEQGKAVASGPWKIQNDKKGIMQIARLSLDCNYCWIKSDIVPPILLGLKWHEVEKSDM